jgi:glycosyltransferase involved in cell wall biosynthesis
MRVAVIITVRNEELHIRRCLEQWISDACDVVLIDHDSSDKTVHLAREFLGRGLISIERLPWRGYFSLKDQLRQKKSIAAELDHDWLIHADADEWHESPWGYRIVDAIARVDAEGFNCIEFDEFSFVPWPNEDFARHGYHKLMLTYYRYELFKPYLVRAWRRDIDAHNIEAGGHFITASGELRIYPQHFILRHYIALSLDHVCNKYIGRTFDQAELKVGWHGSRAVLTREHLRLRPSPYLRQLPRWDSIDFDRSNPTDQFFWEWQ